MTGTNHIAGGLTITGISCSFWDINIFASPIFLSLTVVGSLLPDIDHTKSLLGKIVYPLAKWLDKKYGHRTITHSLLFLVLITFLAMFVERIFYDDLSRSLILFFAVLSHLILDMMTVTGIPLFYPFLRNPCVIPANPSYRIRTGNIKAESMAFAFFCLVLFSSFDLMKHGFWTSYNRSFGTIQHVFREFKNSSNIVEVEYSYSEYGQQKNGKAYLITADENSIFLFDGSKSWKIEKSDPSIRDLNLLPSDSGYPFIFTSHVINDLGPDSLNLLLDNQIVKGKISANQPFVFNGKQVQEFEFDLVHSPKIYQVLTDSTEIKKVQSQIQLKRLKLAEIKRNNETKLFNKKLLYEKRDSLLNRLKMNLDLYQRNKTEGAIKKVVSQIENIQSKGLGLSNTKVLEFELQELESQLLVVDNAMYFDGLIEILEHELY